MDVDRAANFLGKGGMAVIYDGDQREGEADLVFCASFATPDRIEIMRKDCGGLICAAISGKDAQRLGLPFIADVLERDGALEKMVCKRTRYGDKPAFSISVNHKGAFTGITDNDRALTLRRLDEFLRNGKDDLSVEFCTPGHVFILVGSGIKNRRGHTELALELIDRGRLGGAVVLCEMLGSGGALPKDKAIEYAEMNGFAFLEGTDILSGVV